MINAGDKVSSEAYDITDGKVIEVNGEEVLVNFVDEDGKRVDEWFDIDDLEKVE